jgi:outer membrane receptor protein involved in Fe transport
MMIDRRCAARGSAALALAIAATAATAQQAAPATPAAVASGDEIIVTARKRQESLIDVPVSVAAITAADRRLLVLDGMKDYLRQLPGTTLVSSGPEYLQDITIRGQGSGRLGFSETATGLFRDGLYNAGGGFGGRSLSRLDFFDSERIEVLRGPQGALYGRNSVGGAVDVISTKPRDAFEGELTLRYSDPDRAAVEGVVNAPLVADRVAVRIGGFYDKQSSGFVTNLTTGNKLDRQRFTGGRAAVRLTPSETTTLDFAIEGYDARTPAFGNLGRRPTRTDGAVLDPSRYTRNNLDREGFATIEETSVFGALEQDLGFATFTLKGSYKTRDGNRSGEDGDHFAGHSGIVIAPAPSTLTADYSPTQIEDYERTVVQAYLASPAGGAVTWLLGAEYLTSDSGVNLDQPFCPAYRGTAQPVTPGCVVGAVGTLTAAGAAVRNAARLTVNNDTFTEKLESPSLFGSVELRLGERTFLAGEARVQRDSRDFTFQRFAEDPLVFFGTGPVPAGLLAPISVDPDGPTGPLAASPVQFCPPTLPATQCTAAGVGPLSVVSGSKKTFFTPTVSLRHRVSDDASIYARIATAYRPGGFNSNLPQTTVRSQFPGQLNYGPERATSFEGGAKGRVAGFGVNFAAYYLRTRDVQLVSAPSSISRGFFLQNAGDASVYGYELEARRRWGFAGGGSFVLSGALSSQKGDFKDGATALIDVNNDGVPDVANLSGKEVPRLRDYQIALNGVATVPLSPTVDLILSGGMQTAKGGFEDPNNARTYPGYTLFDARVGVQTGRFTLSAFGRNLTNQSYLLNILTLNEYYSERRVLGVELKVAFQ